jgi:putative transcriptional regulator
MATVGKTLAEIRASRPRFDRERFDSITDDDIAAMIAADPDLAPDMSEAPLPAMPRALRQAANLSQDEFARLLDIPVSLLRDWEEARTVPDPAAATLFRLMARDLSHALRLLREQTPFR